MKSDKNWAPTKHINGLLVGALTAAFLLTGCGGAPTKEATDKTVEVKPSLNSTKQYLPVRQYDKDGNELPFVATPNPYTEMTGRVEKDAVTGFIAARKALKSEAYDEADRVLQQVVTADKSLAGPWVMRGFIAEQNKDVEGAIGHYRQAIAVNKLNVNAYIPLARLLREQGKFLDAQNIYAQALAVWKDFPEAHLNLAILYDIYLNDPLQAQQHMEAYQFLSGGKDAKVSAWLTEIQSRTGIEPNLYIGPSSTSQITKREDDKSDSSHLTN